MRVGDAEFGLFGAGEDELQRLGSEGFADRRQHRAGGGLHFGLQGIDQFARLFFRMALGRAHEVVFILFGKSRAEESVQQIRHQPRHKLGALLVVKPDVADVHFVKTRGQGEGVGGGAVFRDLKFGAAQVVAKIDFKLKDHRHLLLRQHPTQVFFSERTPRVVGFGDDFLGYRLKHRKLADGTELLDRGVNRDFGCRGGFAAKINEKTARRRTAYKNQQCL